MMNRDEAPRRHFHDELDALQARLLEMAGLVEKLLEIASDAVLNRDPSASSYVRKQDDVIDEIEVEIDERVVELLALQQPMAKDLRQIIATLKVANDLERMGDHAVNIARAAKRISKGPPMPSSPELVEMIAITRSMVADSLASYVGRDSEVARRVCATDDSVDDLRSSLFKLLLNEMRDDPVRIKVALELLLVSQNVERIADLATNISEDVVFLVEGKTIKHGFEDEDED